MTQQPTCPVCASNDRVVALEPPRFVRDEPMTDDAPFWSFDCGRCNTVFAGTDDEFVRMFRRRELWKKQHPKEGR